MRRILIACCTFATVVGPLVVASPAAACPYGTVQPFNGVCTSGQGGAPPPLGITIPPQGADIVTHGQFPTVNGIRCNQKHLSTCYGMSQQP